MSGSTEVIKGIGGHFRLNSWILANIIHLGTERFCRRFLDRSNDPCGRQTDQMTQAARSACANIAEGAARHATSRETEMRLTDVARASLFELQSDFLHWLMAQGKAPWPRSALESLAILRQPLDKPQYGEDITREACLHILAQERHFARWLLSGDGECMANALLLLISRATQLLRKQLSAQESAFKEEGGFAEGLTRARLEAVKERAHAEVESAPTCPKCGQPMRKRIAKRGANAGRPFWSCADYPNCNGTRPWTGECKR